MPDFWRGCSYEKFLADPKVLAAVDFVNIQMYNQVPFPDAAHVFTKDIYDPASKAPTSFASIVAAAVAASAGAVTAGDVNAKLLLGFPCKDGSFPVGKDNLNQCGQAQADLVHTGVSELGCGLHADRTRDLPFAPHCPHLAPGRAELNVLRPPPWSSQTRFAASSSGRRRRPRSARRTSRRGTRAWRPPSAAASGVACDVALMCRRASISNLPVNSRAR